MNKQVLLILLLLSVLVLSGCSETRYYSNCVSCRSSWVQDINRAIANIPASNSSADLSNYFNKTAYWINASNSFLKSYTETDPIAIPKINNLNSTKLKITDWQTNISNYYTKSSYWSNSTASFVKRNDWTTIDNYPTGCSAGQYVSAIGDTLTCSTPTGGGSTCKTMFYDEFTYWTTARTNGIGVCAALSSGTAAAVTSQYIGTFRMSDSTTANGGYICRSDSTSMYFQGGENLTFRFSVNTIATAIHHFGFSDSTSAAVGTDYCAIDGANLVFTARCKNNAGPTANATTYTVTTGVYYIGEIVALTSSKVQFTIYDAARTTVLWRVTISANVPNTSARAFGVVLASWETTTGAAAVMSNFDYVKLEDCTWT